VEVPSVGYKLAAIFAAEVQRYSRLMGTDEESTPHRLKARTVTSRCENRLATWPDRRDHRRRHPGGICQRGRCSLLSVEVQ